MHIISSGHIRAVFLHARKRSRMIQPVTYCAACSRTALAYYVVRCRISASRVFVLDMPAWQTAQHPQLNITVAEREPFGVSPSGSIGCSKKFIASNCKHSNTMELQLESVHESVVNAVLARCDLRSKSTLMCTCRYLRTILSASQHWKELHWKDHEEQQGMCADNFATVLQRSRGACEVIHLARYAMQHASPFAKRAESGQSGC